jgi:cobyric acid synthase
VKSIYKALAVLPVLGVIALCVATTAPASAETISAQTSAGYVVTNGVLKSVEVDKSSGNQLNITITGTITKDGNVCGSGCVGGTGTFSYTKTDTNFSTYNKQTFNGTQYSYLSTCGASVTITPW